MKLLHALLPACALLLPCVLSAESTFEGKVTMQVSSSSKDGPQSLNYSIKGDLMRIDVNTAKGQAGVIMDGKNNQMIILMAQQHMYMIQPLGGNAGNPQAPQAGAPAAHPSGAPANGNFTNTGIKEDILGYSCTKLLVTSDKGTAEIWVTDQLGNFAGLFHGGGFGHRQPPAEWEDALKGVGFFPMRVISTDKDGKVFKLEVTAVDKTSVPDSVFSPPDGWRKFDMGAIMGGAGLGGFGGGRPTDGSN
jgi:hypothetical protein